MILKQEWDHIKQFIQDIEIKKIIETKENDIILGLKAKYFVEKGLFVPDEITNELFNSSFKKKNYKNQILDGYPRTLSQSKFLLELLRKQNSKIE